MENIEDIADNKKNKKNVIIFDGAITSSKLRLGVWRLAWPTIGEQCLNLLVGLTDVFFVGHLTPAAAAELGYGSAEALTAAALGNFFTWVAFVTFSSMSIPATALVARAYGANNRQQAAHIGRQAMLMAVLLGIVVGALIHVSAPFLIEAFGATGSIATIGAQYLEITSWGMPLWAIMVTGSACLRGSGDTRTPLLVVMIVNGVNILGSSLLVNGAFGLPIMGVKGAATGAACAWTVGGLIIFFRLFMRHRHDTSDANLYLKFSLKFDGKIIRELTRIGLPTFGEQIFFQIAIFFFARLVVGLGTVSYAAHNAIITIDSISFLPGLGFGIANTILVGQCLGAGRPDLADRYAKTAYHMGLLFMSLMGLTFFIFPEFFLSLLVNDQAVIAAASGPLRIAGLFDPLIATVFIYIGALRGAGDTRFPMYGRIISSCGVRFILGYIFIEILGMGLVGVRLAMGLDSVVLATLILWRFRSGRWKNAIKPEVINPTSKPVEGLSLQNVSAPSDE
jgi:putative MATE family efflux protein